ncbi:hypothetical protein BJX64DRAFT_284093 [Aspergillus heterothallicus]
MSPMIPEGWVQYGKGDPRNVRNPQELMHSRHDETLPLEEQVKFMADRHRVLSDFIGYLVDEKDYMENAVEWTGVFPADWTDHFEKILSDTWSFAAEYGYTDSAEKRLTKRQKKEVIASLKGYCVQEDFDSTLSRLNDHHKKSILETFAKIYLVKIVVDNFFKHPFWYVEYLPPGAPETCDEAPWQGVSPEGAVLEQMMSRFEQINPEYGRIWRNLTVRLCNSMYCRLDDDINFGKALAARRRARCRSLAKEILSNQTFLSLLKPTDDPARREEALGSRLVDISDTIVPMLSQEPSLELRTLDELEPKYHHTSKTLEAEWCHFLSQNTDHIPSPRLDGSRVLFIENPFALRVHTDRDEYIVAMATAVLEDPAGSDAAGKASK